ncbi:sensor histidine kinase [Kitasatospora sp. HPMI-4]|uniref:sensor histidine kinase n=1 Tax=Kitasatospora sp. HPMI-4 TaxID=3448443 RepID=UPI003F1A653D
MRRPGPSLLGIRGRLFAGFGALLLAAAGLMALVLVAGMHYLPSYQTTVVVPDGTVHWENSTPASPLPSTPSTGTPIQPTHGEPQHISKVSTLTDVQSAVLTSCAAGLGLVAVSGTVAGWFLTRRLLAPLRALDEAASRVAEGDLGHRIDARGPDDELHSLADSFDTMTVRLERAFGAQRRFAANASHELLTPLTTTRTVLQVLSASPGEEGVRELAPMLTEANERSIGIVRSLLRLAETEHTPLERQRTDLAALVAEAVAAVGTVAQERGVRVEGGAGPDGRQGVGPLWIEADPVLLRQLVGNLLENALTHNVPGGRVVVRLSGDGRLGAVVTVSNTGPAVDPETVDRLFEPFYRAGGRVAPAERDADGGGRAPVRGHGLGLSIVSAIAGAHGGKAGAVPRPGGGLTVTVQLPGGASAARP